MMKTILPALTALAFSAGTASASTVTLFEDDFATEVGGVSSPVATVNFTAFENWNVAEGSVDFYANGGFGLPCGSGGCVDLDGTTNNAGILISSASYALTTGTTYSMSLTFAGRNGSGQEFVDFGFVGRGFDEVTRLSFAPGDATTGTFTFDYMATADTTAFLAISTPGVDNFGMLLDAVSLTATTPTVSPVPLPASALLLLAGMGALPVLRRTRRSKAIPKG